MSKIVKFKKEHVAGIEKGAVKSFDEKTALRMIETGFASEADEAQLDAYNLKVSKRKIASTLDAAKAEANSSTGDCEECGNNAECEECKEKEAAKDGAELEEKVYHILTQEDIDANELAAEGLSVGDEVELNASDELLIDADGKLIKKDLGNV